MVPTCPWWENKSDLLGQAGDRVFPLSAVLWPRNTLVPSGFLICKLRRLVSMVFELASRPDVQPCIVSLAGAHLSCVAFGLSDFLPATAQWSRQGSSYFLIL